MSKTTTAAEILAEQDRADQLTDTRTRVDPTDVSVAVVYPGNRVEKVAVPLQASRMDVAIDPPNPSDYDILLVDNADRDLGVEVLKKPFHDATLVYRMRGDVFRELDLWDMHPLKKWAAKRVVLQHVDATLAVSPGCATQFAARTGVPTGVAGLVKDPTEWPTTVHADNELRIATLTNFDYQLKIAPILEWAPVVEEVLSESGGYWRVCGDGEYSDIAEEALAEYDHVEFAGYVDPNAELNDSNCMIHASRLDALPNAMLEGLASELPVITTDFHEFLAYGEPLVCVDSETRLRDTLHEFRDPKTRAERGRAGLERIRRDHTAMAVARQYEAFFTEVLANA
ncbi:glycosyltransferase [Halorubrum sp. LN27]|uniref:glycosyltransferase n=1 Tax=Halorubrum sp. LN27 TaxID=2801032 RepID=UPI00190DF1AB|nr:glycosyltransferase [Halorubrum sp. LN27]